MSEDKKKDEDRAFDRNKTHAEYLKLVRLILFEKKPERIRKLVAQLKHEAKITGVPLEKELHYLYDFIGKENIDSIIPAPPTNTYHGYLKATDLQDVLRHGEKIEQLNEKLFQLTRESDIRQNLDKWNEFIQELLANMEIRQSAVLLQIAYRYLERAGFTFQITSQNK